VGLQSADKTKTHPKAKLQNTPTFNGNGSHSHVCLLLVIKIKLALSSCVNDNRPTYQRTNRPTPIIRKSADNQLLPIIDRLSVHLQHKPWIKVLLVQFDTGHDILPTGTHFDHFWPPLYYACTEMATFLLLVQNLTPDLSSPCFVSLEMGNFGKWTMF